MSIFTAAEIGVMFVAGMAALFIWAAIEVALDKREPETCPRCNGEGWVITSGNVTGLPVRLCSCGGSGVVR